MSIEPNELARIAAGLQGLGVAAADTPPPQEGDPRLDLRRALRTLMARTEGAAEFQKIQGKVKLPKQPDGVPFNMPAMEAWWDQSLAIVHKATQPIALKIEATLDALLRPGGKELNYDDTMKVVLVETKRILGAEFTEMLAEKIEVPDDVTGRLMLANMVSGRVMREEIATLQQRVGGKKTMEILNAPHRPPVPDDERGEGGFRTMPNGKVRILQPMTESWLEDALRGPNPATQFNAMLYAGANPNLPENDDLVRQFANLPMKSVKQILDKGKDPVNFGLLAVDGQALDGNLKRSNALKLELSAPNRPRSPEKSEGETPLMQAIRADDVRRYATPFSATESNLLLGFGSPEETRNPYRQPTFVQGGMGDGTFKGATETYGPKGMSGILRGASRGFTNGRQSLEDPQYYTIEALLQAGADPDRTDGFDFNALRSAATRNDDTLARVMIRYQADVNHVYREPPATDGEGNFVLGNEETPLTVAVKNYEPVKKNSESPKADVGAGLQGIKAALQSNQRIAPRKDNEQTQAQQNFIDGVETPKPELEPSVAEILIDAGANLAWRDQKGLSPLMKLLETENKHKWEMAEILVAKGREKGVDVINATDNELNGVLVRELQQETPDWENLVRLMKLGASRNVSMIGIEENGKGEETEREMAYLEILRLNAGHEARPYIYLVAKGEISPEEAVETLVTGMLDADAPEEDREALRPSARSVIGNYADELYGKKYISALEAERLGATQPEKDRAKKREAELNPPEGAPLDTTPQSKPAQQQESPALSPEQSLPSEETPAETTEIPPPRYAYREVEAGGQVVPGASVPRARQPDRSNAGRSES